MTSPFAIRLAGAAGEVTGSCTLVEAGSRRIAVVFGLIQGKPEREATNVDMQIDRPDWLDALALTHVHADHCGRLPMLTRSGFSGPVLCTHATAQLLPLILGGAARLQKRLASEAKATGRVAPAVLFDQREVDRLCSMLVPLDLGEPFEVAAGLTLTLHPIGHILGAACVLLTDTAGPRPRRVLISGDVGNALGEPMPPPPPPPNADMVVMECTRGDVNENIPAPPEDQLAAVLTEARIAEQIIMVPTFGLGRSHQLLYRFGQLSRQGRLGMPVLLDSHVASITAPMHGEYGEQLSPAAQDLLAQDLDPLSFPELTLIYNRRQARIIKDLQGPAVIMAGNGFGEGGPIVEHMIRLLPSRKGRLLLSGFCMPGTVTGRLTDDPPRIKLRGQWVSVEAPIDRINGFSGHADAAQLEQWIESMPAGRPHIVLNHGDPAPRATFAARLSALGYATSTPEAGELIPVPVSCGP
jgi:metallo-beta-lactamase family protein